MTRARLGVILVCLLLAPLVVSCTKTKSTVGKYLDVDTNVKLTFDVTSDINPDDRGRPSPLVVRLYELKSPILFERANFLDVYERDEEVLGADYIARHALKSLTPGADRVEELRISDEAQYIALFAEFNQYRDAEYRLVIPVVPHVKTKAKISVSGITLESMD